MRAVPTLHGEERIPHGRQGQIFAPGEAFGAVDGVCDQLRVEADGEYNVTLQPNLAVELLKSQILTCEAFQSFESQASTCFNIVRAKLVYNTRNRQWISEQLGDLSHAPVLVDSWKTRRIEICVPIQKIDCCLFNWRAGILKFSKVSIGSYVMVIFVDLA